MIGFNNRITWKKNRIESVIHVESDVLCMIRSCSVEFVYVDEERVVINVYL